MVKFSELLRAATRDGDGLVLDVPADWAQGRSVFGGLQAAFAVQAMRAHVPADPLRSLQATFIGPLAGRMRVETRVLRTGSAATHVEARISGDALTTIVIGVFGKPRTSAVVVERVQPPVGRERALRLPYIAGLAPAFLQHFEGTWLRGALPTMGTTETQHVIEVELHDDAPASEATAIALADYAPPLALSFLTKPAAGGTLTWLLELVAERFERGPHRIDVELLAARDGYTSQAMTLWSPGGHPVAIGHQTMTVFG